MKAIISDLDGVLLDTEPAMAKACIKGFKEKYGITSRMEDYEPLCGMGAVSYFTALCKLYGIPFHESIIDELYEFYFDVIETEARHFPGVPEKIKEWHDSGIVLAVASSSPERKVYANLKVAGLDLKYFSAIVTGDDVKEAKPDPAIFIEAARRIGANPADCLVYEDSIHGIKAAKLAGMRAIGIRGLFKDDELFEDGAEKILNSIAED